jgi:hypothetical protein
MTYSNADDLDILLNLNGCEYTDANGYGWKVRAKRVAVSAARPHGLSYSLTLHDSFNRRVLGFDNAHAIPGKGNKKYRCVRHDHTHEPHHCELIHAYEFESAAKLVADFFTAVRSIIDAQ